MAAAFESVHAMRIERCSAIRFNRKLKKGQAVMQSKHSMRLRLATINEIVSEIQMRHSVLVPRVSRGAAQYRSLGRQPWEPRVLTPCTPPAPRERGTGEGVVLLPRACALG
jgi:hypothetical protein